MCFFSKRDTKISCYMSFNGHTACFRLCMHASQLAPLLLITKVTYTKKYKNSLLAYMHAEQMYRHFCSLVFPLSPPNSVVSYPIYELGVCVLTFIANACSKCAVRPSRPIHISRTHSINPNKSERYRLYIRFPTTVKRDSVVTTTKPDFRSNSCDVSHFF